MGFLNEITLFSLQRQVCSKKMCASAVAVMGYFHSDLTLNALTPVSIPQTAVKANIKYTMKIQLPLVHGGTDRTSSNLSSLLLRSKRSKYGTFPSRMLKATKVKDFMDCRHIFGLSTMSAGFDSDTQVRLDLILECYRQHVQWKARLALSEIWLVLRTV